MRPEMAKLSVVDDERGPQGATLSARRGGGFRPSQAASSIPSPDRRVSYHANCGGNASRKANVMRLASVRFDAGKVIPGQELMYLKQQVAS